MSYYHYYEIERNEVLCYLYFGQYLFDGAKKFYFTINEAIKLRGDLEKLLLITLMQGMLGDHAISCTASEQYN